MKKGKFKEIQQFRSWDVFALLGFLTLGLVYRVIAGFMGWWGAAPNSSISLYLLFALILGLGLAYFASLRLLVVVDEKGIKYQFYPWHFRKHRIKWDDVVDFHVVNVPLKSAVTGWCVDFSGEKRFSVTGRRKGLWLELKSGEKIFIGCSCPEKAADFFKSGDASLHLV